MEASTSPFGDGFPPVHCGMPANFQAFHEGFEKFEVDDVVFDNEDVDRGNSTIKQAGRKFGGIVFRFAGGLVVRLWSWGRRLRGRSSCTVRTVGRNWRSGEWWWGGGAVNIEFLGVFVEDGQEPFDKGDWRESIP